VFFICAVTAYIDTKILFIRFINRVKRMLSAFYPFGVVPAHVLHAIAFRAFFHSQAVKYL
jgi:hypothetical protein